MKNFSILLISSVLFLCLPSCVKKTDIEDAVQKILTRSVRVDYDLNGGSFMEGVVLKDSLVVGENFQRIPIPTRKNYDFVGWEPEVPEKVPDTDISLTAIWEPAKRKVIQIPSSTVTFTMCRIPAGFFQMGAPEGYTSSQPDEMPRHKVSISKDFFMGETEVTQELWYAVMDTRPSCTFTSSAWLPVETVSYEELFEENGFFARLNALTGMEFRLPTEAEWEYAAIGGVENQLRYFGDDWYANNHAWHGKNSGTKTHDVKQLEPNHYGLYDIHGNVHEWCSDWHSMDYYSKSPVNDPKGPEQSAQTIWRVYRGGCYTNDPKDFRSAARKGAIPSDKNPTIGFRLCLTAPKIEE